MSANVLRDTIVSTSQWLWARNEQNAGRLEAAILKVDTTVAENQFIQEFWFTDIKAMKTKAISPVQWCNDLKLVAQLRAAVSELDSVVRQLTAMHQICAKSNGAGNS